MAIQAPGCYFSNEPPYVAPDNEELNEKVEMNGITFFVKGKFDFKHRSEDPRCAEYYSGWKISTNIETEVEYKGGAWIKRDTGEKIGSSDTVITSKFLGIEVSSIIPIDTYLSYRNRDDLFTLINEYVKQQEEYLRGKYIMRFGPFRKPSP